MMNSLPLPHFTLVWVRRLFQAGARGENTIDESQSLHQLRRLLRDQEEQLTRYRRMLARARQREQRYQTILLAYRRQEQRRRNTHGVRNTATIAE